MLKVLLRRRVLIGVAVIAAAGLVVAGLVVRPGSGGSQARTSTRGSSTLGSPSRGSEVLRALATTPGASPAAVGKALTTITQSLPAAERPTCAPTSDPSFKTPTAQFPNGRQGLGVPFVAALTSGELLSGYREAWTPGVKHPKYPWSLTLTGITGWVTGLLEVPSLKTVVNQTTGIMFCDDLGFDPNTSKISPRLHFTLINDSNIRDNTQNYDPSGKLGTYAPYFFSLKAAGPPLLNVSSVAPDGSINLAGSTQADTTVALWTHATPKQPFRHTQTCTQFPGTRINIASTAGPEPATAPPGATLQFQPHGLSGGFPSATNNDPATATLVGNNFAINAFNIATCQAWPIIDGGLSGFTAQGANYAKTCGVKNGALQCSDVASPPGWSEFTVKATITTLDLPYGATKGLGF